MTKVQVYCIIHALGMRVRVVKPLVSTTENRWERLYVSRALCTHNAIVDLAQKKFFFFLFIIRFKRKKISLNIK